MKQKIFLRLSGVEGESDDPRHQGAIELWSYNLNVANANAAQVEPQYRLTVVKKRDRLSGFFNEAAGGRLKFAEAVLTVEKSIGREGAVDSKIYALRPVRLDFVSSNVEDDLVTLIGTDLKVTGG